MSYIEIKRWDNDEVIFSGEYTSVKECLEEGIKKDVSFAYATLRNADLQDANLYNANLQDANLYNATLRYATLRNANLQDANLYNATLRNANLQDANLRNATLRNAILRNADLPDFLIVPEIGSFFAFKKTSLGVINYEKYWQNYIISCVSRGK